MIEFSEREKTIASMLADGKKQREIAVFFGCSASRINGIVEWMRIKMRFLSKKELISHLRKERQNDGSAIQ
jgi:DNA-binding CsgD family transcriptional regulator